MRTALVLVAALARTASAQPGDTAPQPPAPADPAPAPPAEPPAAPEPKADPAYGDQPGHAVIGAESSTAPGLRTGRGIVVRYTPNRSKENIILLSVLAGSSLVFGGIGLYFHFDSRSSSDMVSAHKFTGLPWTQERQDIYDDAHHSATVAKVAYGIGSAVLLTTAIVYMVTEPKMKEMSVASHASGKPTALVAPTRGGAIVGGAWSF